ncbi:glycosyltransferase family 4 protein [Paraburkholderia phenazinium]|jgi:glycosyltransferase involved in cell wall biosynthesis|uniref:Glycosyltransferase involved in cell wall bisynthesis n=1 Tax=Paraburkholderia phenazinium TaxID=60549 RepID=A0A1G8CJ24_9BURK|nr:glycosyltransferase family 4 protein [Paraburkholderia phenazinium]SDH45464.1 Glycosyltransferase involved in cell wall bisynthesis [Paraburkholderia phenazinium]
MEPVAQISLTPGLPRAKLTVFYVQPLVTRYRVEVIDTLSRLFKVKVFANSSGIESRGFSREAPSCDEFVETGITHVFTCRIKLQARVFGEIVRVRPAAVLIFADMSYLSLWLALLAGRALGVPVVIHGQGLYRHAKPRLARTVCYRAAVALSTRYVCYSEASRLSLERIGCPRAKLIVADNSLCVTRTVKPEEKTGNEQGVLFLGRLRDGSSVECLIEAVEQLHRHGHEIVLHLVGDGEHRGRLQRTYANSPYLIWHGAIFDDEEIAAISRRCRIGCYPGDAGLSVVHMFGLSLPPLVHDQLELHMGPEPEYVEHGANGFLYHRESGAGTLAATLEQIWVLPPESIREVSARAFSKYQQLNSPSLGQRLAAIVDSAIQQ